MCVYVCMSRDDVDGDANGDGDASLCIHICWSDEVFIINSITLIMISEKREEKRLNSGPDPEHLKFGSIIFNWPINGRNWDPL